MAWSDILTLFGLVLGTVGAIVLTYDLFYKPGANFQATVIKTKLENLRQFRAEVRERINKYPQPPYTPAEIQQFLQDEEKEWEPRERELAKQDAEFQDKYDQHVQKLGGYGVLLIVLGFILQIAGILVHAKEEKEKESAHHEETHRTAPHHTDLQFARPFCVQPFPSGEDRGVDAESSVRRLADNLGGEMSRNRLMSLIFVGSVDKQPLRREQAIKFKSNRGLAKARAVWVKEKLRTLLPTFPSKLVVLAAGPTIEAKTQDAKQLDRFVAVYPVWEDETIKTAEVEREFNCGTKLEEQP